MLEATREEVRRRVPRTGLGAKVEDFLLRKVIAHPGRLRAAVGLLAASRSLGLALLSRRLHLTRLFMGKTAETFEKFMPAIPEVAERASLVGVHAAEGKRLARVGFLEGCVMSQLFGPTNRATLKVLRWAGCEVVVARGQGCCGALHLHQGDGETARGLARKNVAAFSEAGPLDAIVVNSAGCGSAMKEYGHVLDGEPGAADMAAKVKDVSEFLARLGIPQPKGRIEKKVAYQDACHLLHGQKVSAEPRALLEKIPGLMLVPIPDPDRCCGSAGIYNLTQPEESAAILDQKLDAIESTGAEIVASGNPGCLLQIGVGLRKRGRLIEVLHTMDLLARALP
jgi:glycolate oxidase iron-sulfur subunit